MADEFVSLTDSERLSLFSLKEKLFITLKNYLQVKPYLSYFHQYLDNLMNRYSNAMILQIIRNSSKDLVQENTAYHSSAISSIDGAIFSCNNIQLITDLLKFFDTNEDRFSNIEYNLNKIEDRLNECILDKDILNKFEDKLNKMEDSNIEDKLNKIEDRLNEYKRI